MATASTFRPTIAENPELNGMGEPGLVEQTRHSINTGGIKVPKTSAQPKALHEPHASRSNVDRESYYSAYGRTPKSHSRSRRTVHLLGKFDKCLFMPADPTAGF